MEKFASTVTRALLALVLALSATAMACAPIQPPHVGGAYQQETGVQVYEDREYSDKDSVALYVYLYGHLPGNYVSKTKAREAGWVSTEGNLWEVLPGKSIGGGEFYNDDDRLPDAPGRRWTECDVGYDGGFRNGERVVFSNDRLVYYTGDHYKTFERLY